MDLSKYASLPDSLTPVETCRLFRELLALEQQPSSTEAIALAEAMDEIADRHWHTYSLLDDSTRRDVDAWVIRNWDHSSMAMTRLLISIIAKLGLAKSGDMLRREINVEMPLSVKEEIRGALREFGSNVDDPYSGLRRCVRSEAMGSDLPGVLPKQS